MRMCVKNCSYWRSQCCPCLENSPWTVTSSIPDPASASPHSSQQSCKGGVLPAASCKMCCKHGLQLAFCFMLRWDLQGPVWWTFIIPTSGCITIPTPLWHKDINMDFSSKCGWALKWSTLRISCLTQQTNRCSLPSFF
jgi:hypothetical protein